MQELSQTPLIHEPSRFPWLASLGLLIIAIVATISLYGYGFVQEQRIDTLTSDVAALDKEINASEQDKKVIIANILKSTALQPSVDVKGILKDFRAVAAKNGVRLHGFAINNDIITSSLTAAWDSTGNDAVTTIIAMMRSKKLANGLTLEPIYTVAGTSSERTTNVSFRILSPNSSSNVTK